MGNSHWNKIRKCIEAISSLLAKVAMWGTFAMMALIGYDVISRYLFNKPVLFSDEISAYLLVCVCFLGAAGTLKEDRHITVDVLVIHLNKRVQLWLRFITLVISLGFLMIFCWHTFVVVYLSYVRNVTVPSILLTPIWIPQLLLPFGTLALILQMIVEISKSIRNLQNSRQNEKN